MNSHLFTWSGCASPIKIHSLYMKSSYFHQRKPVFSVIRPRLFLISQVHTCTRNAPAGVQISNDGPCWGDTVGEFFVSNPQLWKGGSFEKARAVTLIDTCLCQSIWRFFLEVASVSLSTKPNQPVVSAASTLFMILTPRTQSKSNTFLVQKMILTKQSVPNSTLPGV